MSHVRLGITRLGFVGILLRLTAATAGVAEPKTLTRFHDPVIVDTGILKGLSDHRTASYRLMRARAKLVEPIPFQFDARDDDGLIFSGVSTADGSVFDDDDELVFMAKDTGDRVDRAALPPESDESLQIEVFDPVDGSRGWAYLVHFPGQAPAASPVRYATFDVQANEAKATFYQLTYAPGRSFFTNMRIMPAGGGNGGRLMNRMKVRVRPTLSLLVTTWSPEFTEESFAVTIDGVKNGPVRAIRRVRQSLDLGEHFPQGPSGTVYTYYYLSSFTTPSVFSIPWIVLKALRDFEFEGVSDFGPQAMGMQYWDGANVQGLRFTGSTQAPVTDEDHDWWAVSGPPGTCLHAFVVPEQWRRWGIVRGTAFHDNASEGHTAGYNLLHMADLRSAGAYEMNLATTVLSHPFRPGDQVEPLRMLHDPLQIRVKPVE